MKRIKVSLVIFDLDGTLLDSVFDIATSVNAMRRHLGLSELPLDLVYTFIGDGAHVLMQRSLPPEYSEAERKQALAYFLEHYREHMLDHTTLFPGVLETLEGLRGKTLAVITHKRSDLAEAMLKTLNILDRFPYVLGMDRLARKKPDPYGIHFLQSATGAPSSETMMVGDTANDIMTGRNAGVFTCGVTFGIAGEKLRALQPDYLIGDMRQLLEIIE